MKVTKENFALTAMFTAVVLYSLFPLFNAFSVGAVSPLVYVFKACVVAVVIDAGLIVIYRLRHKTTQKISFSKVRPAFLAGAAFLATIAYCILVYAFSIGSNSGVTMLYELWPLVVFFVLPVVFRGRFLRVSVVEAIAGLIAIAGLGLIVFSGHANGHDAGTATRLPGDMLGLLAGITMAVAVLLKSKSIVGSEIGDLSFADFAIIDLVNRAMAAGYAFLGIILFTPTNLDQIMQWDSSFGFGIIEGLGGLLYWIAVAQSKRSSIQLLLYLAPVFAFVWLYLVGMAELAAGIIFGSILIFSSNIVAHFRGEQTVAFFLAVVACIGFGALSYLTVVKEPGNGFGLVSVSITLYAILVGFLLSRLADRNLLQRQACKDALDVLPESYPGPLKVRIVEFLRDSFRRNSKATVNAYETIIANTEVDEDMRRKLATVALLRVNPVSAGEMLATIFVGTLVITSGFASRPNSFFGDVFAYVLAVVVVYLTTTIIEQKDIRLGEGRIMRISLQIQDEQDDPAFDFVVAGMSLVIGIVILVSIAIALKHELILPV